jgi:hypothetical protein
MRHHPNLDCHNAIERLMGCLARYERRTGRGALLMVIPEDRNEPIFRARGNLVACDNNDDSVDDFISVAMAHRRRDGVQLSNTST